MKGCISHDPANHQKMTDTRAAKVAKVADDIPAQAVWGDAEGDLLVVGWGGTRGHLQNAVDEMRREDKKVSLCHFNYINPLPNPQGCICSLGCATSSRSSAGSSSAS